MNCRYCVGTDINYVLTYNEFNKLKKMLNSLPTLKSRVSLEVV